MAEDELSLKVICFRVFFCFCLTHLSSASCENNPVGIADGFIYMTASSEHNGSTPANNARLNYTAGSSWCASTSNSNPYLQIDLQTLHVICAVSTQGNLQGDQWVETYTLNSSTDGATWTDYKEGGQINKKSFIGNYDKNSAVKNILYNGVAARYLRFLVDSNHNGACLRVEIFGVPRSKGNIALFKPTSQSSTYSTLVSSNAVDGGRNNNYTHCTHTLGNKANPWWRVDLEREEPVAEVHILNRKGCCAERLNGAEIRVGNSTANGGATNRRCAGNIQIPTNQEKAFFCIPRAYGRYVSIRIPGNSETLTLCEVEVYSTYISRTNLALNQPAEQIDVDTQFGAVASRAVDGNNSTDFLKDNSCTHTTRRTDPWWRVDLGSSVAVTEVVIVNRACDGECGTLLSSFEIRIGDGTQNGGQTNPSCGGTLSLDNGQTKSFPCLPVLVGRYVYVRIPGNNKVLNLCEVEVYSTRQNSNSVEGCSSDPVGISDSSIIRNQRFSASSTGGGSNPYDGRLTGSNRWMPSSNNNANDFLQIDLGSVYFVCGVATQGNPNADHWTKTYKIGTSLNNVNWTIYVEDNVQKAFIGNSDRNSIVRSDLYQPVAAKFIRFYPVTFKINKALRVEVYGSLQGTLRLSTNQPNADQPPFTTPTPTQDYPVCFEEVLEGVTWSNTSRKETDFKPCPYGKRGTASRKCSAEGIWNKANFTDCSSEDFNKLNDAMEAIMKGEQSDLSAQQVLSWLAYASQPVKNNSLSTPEINKTELLIGVNILVKLAEYNNKNGNVSSTEDFQYFAQVASNLLESTNKRTWQELDKAGQGRSQFLVKAMEDYGLGVAATLNESTASRVVQRKNLKIRIDIVGENSPLRDRGLNVAYNQSSIYLPPPLFRSPQDTRVVTVIYLTLHEVLSLPREGKDESHQTASANTTIVSSTLSPRPQDVLSNPVKILLGNQKTHRKLRVPVNGKCVFWRPGEVARWSTSGCRLVRSESNASVTTCECDHLTIFAALMDPYGTSPPSKPLEIISIVGCSISLIAVVSTIFMYLISWKAIKRSGGRIGVKVLLQLCTALAVSCALVIFEGSARNKTWCLVVAVSLHYFLLALFSWMLCEGVLHYLVVVKMIPGDEAEDKFKYFCIFGWGFPAMVVAISLGATHTNGYGDSVCWLDVKTGLIWAFIGPALLVICINIVVYVEVLRRMAGSPEAQRMRNRSKEMSRVKASIVLLPLFGIAWLFGLMSFSSETILFKYLFAIFNSLQGLMIFVLHCARNKILRDAVKQQLFKKCSKSHANRRLTPKTKVKQRDKPASSKAIKRSRNEDCEYELEPQTAESRSSAQILDTMLRQEDENGGNDGDDRDEHVQPLSDG